jgi:biopolymer transport protein ExbD
MRGIRKPVVVRPQSEGKHDINVTPLVDVVLVLLIIFMVVMPLTEKDLAVRIPANEEAEPDEQPPPDQILVRVVSSGAFEINGEATPAEGYVEALHTRLSPRAPIDRVVFVSPDDEASYKKLVEALAGARRAGAETLGMVAEPPPVAPTPEATPAPAADAAPAAPTP